MALGIVFLRDTGEVWVQAVGAAAVLGIVWRVVA
jgi:hypothetical protein